MNYDKCATISKQVTWLREIGFQQAGTFFQWGRFAVFAGWKVVGRSSRVKGRKSKVG
jgi:hypothetical protein